MARFYDSLSMLDLSRVEQLLDKGGIEYTIQAVGEGRAMNEILVAAEDLVYADMLLASGSAR